MSIKTESRLNLCNFKYTGVKSKIRKWATQFTQVNLEFFPQNNIYLYSIHFLCAVLRANFLSTFQFEV